MTVASKASGGHARPAAVPVQRAAAAAPAVLAAFVSLVLGACSDRGGGGGKPGVGSGGSGAGAPGGVTPTPGLRGNRAAEPEGPTGEIFHALDRKTTQGFGRGDLAVGGGWIYWIERPRLDAEGLGKSLVRRKRATEPGAPPETVAGPGKVLAIAADAERLFVAGDGVSARPHAGGAAVPVAPGAWLEVVPGDKHLLIRSREQVALVPKTGGTAEVVWEGKHGKLSVDADGDRFIAIPTSPWAQRSAARAITVYEPGAKPAVLAELPEARGDLGVDGGWIYFGGDSGAATPAPLWRIPRAGGGKPERVGDPAWGFGELILRQGTLYGMVFTGAWRLQKLALTPGAQPTVIEGSVPSMVQELATDGSHLYYLTDFEVKRAPL